jgi:hypothetical protein
MAAAAAAAPAPAAPPFKRRKKEPKLLDSQAQLLLLGLLSAVVGDDSTLKQCLITAVQLEAQQQMQQELDLQLLEPALAASAAAAIQAERVGKLGLLQAYQLAQKLSKDIHARAAVSLVWQMPLTLGEARG